MPDDEVRVIVGPAESVGVQPITTSPIESKTYIKLSVGEAITVVVSTVTLISLIVTFLVGYFETKHTVETLKVGSDSTNRKLNTIINQLDKQTEIITIILERDTGLYNRIREIKRNREILLNEK